MITIPLMVDGPIPVRIELFDDSIVEPLEFYELILELDDLSDTSVKLGDTNSTFIVVEDDDSEEILCTFSCYVLLFYRFICGIQFQYIFGS